MGSRKHPPTESLLWLPSLVSSSCRARIQRRPQFCLQTVAAEEISEFTSKCVTTNINIVSLAYSYCIITSPSLTTTNPPSPLSLSFSSLSLPSIPSIPPPFAPLYHSPSPPSLSVSLSLSLDLSPLPVSLLFFSLSLSLFLSLPLSPCHFLFSFHSPPNPSLSLSLPT